MKYLLLLITVSMLLLVGCDDRGTENPKMEVSAEAEYGDFVFNKSGFNEMSFNFQLDGPHSKISGRKINVEIVNNMGHFIGSGSSLYLLTDENGFVTGRYFARDGYGAAQVEFVLDNWPTEKATFAIPVFDFPKIDSLVAGTYTLLPDGLASTSITAHISSANINFYDLDVTVLFEASDGTITQPVTLVDISGVASTNIIAPDYQTFVTIRAELGMDSGSYKTVRIKCENP